MVLNMKHFRWLAIAMTICCVMTSMAQAAKNEGLQLTEQNGPWMIMAAAFSDLDSSAACKKAEALANELRTVYKLDAYVFQKNSTEGAVTEGRPYWVIDEKNPDVKPQLSNKYRYMNPSASAEYSVMVGNFPSVEDRRVAKTLETVRKIQPQSLKNADDGLGQVQCGMTGTGANPLSKAFVVANPLLPRERFVAPGLDPIVMNANKNIKKYSLLDCPGTYTVQVAVLKGVTTLNQRKIAEIRSNGGSFRSEQTLEEADQKAMVLCEELRKKGYDAYVFRDHYASIVTVGSFNSIGSRKGDDFVLTPQVMNLLKTFSASCDPSLGLAGIQRKNLRDIPSLNGKKFKNAPSILFDITPRIIVVPRRPVLNTGTSVAEM